MCSHRYKRTIGSKDLSKKSDEEISCVLGKRRKLTKHKVTIVHMYFCDYIAFV